MVETFAERIGTELTGSIPMSREITQAETRRKTVVELFPDSPAAAGFRALAEKMLLHGPSVVPAPMEENALEELCRY